MKELRELHLRGATGAVRMASWNDREHMVVPVVALVEGVIHAINAEVPEYVPLETLSATPHVWNNRPAVLKHPVLNGRQISANAPHVLEAQGLGSVFNAGVKGNKLHMEAYIDPAKAEKLGAAKMLERLRNGEVVEVSVGAYVVTEPSSGEHNGKPYKAVWKQIVPDHLAFLPDGIGACNSSMGCGTRACEAYLVTAQGFETLEESDRPKHSEKWHRCWTKVQDQGYDESSAAAICTAALEEESYEERGAAQKEKSFVEHIKQFFRTGGGPGSGWHADAGHTEGSQGGKGGKGGSKKEERSKEQKERGKGGAGKGAKHDTAAGAHESAAQASKVAAMAVKQASSPAMADAAAQRAVKESRRTFVESVKAVAGSPKGNNAYRDTARMAFQAARKGDFEKAAQLHEQAARLHKAAASVMNPPKKRNAEEKGKSLRAADEAEVDLTAIEDTEEDLSAELNEYDNQTPADAQESMELIDYTAMQVHLSSIDAMLSHAKELTAQLISDETESPTETPAGEEVEEEIETARLDVLQSLCMAMQGSLSAFMSLAYHLNAPPAIEQTYPARYAAGARNSRADRQVIQEMHDHSVKLGAECSEMKAAGAKPCGCREETMTKDARTAAIKQIAETEGTGFSKEDMKTLEAMSDKQIEGLKGLLDAKAAAEAKAAADVKAAQDKAAAELKAASEKVLTVDEYLKTAPAEIRSLVERQKKQDEARKAVLLGQLKTAQSEYTEDELKAMDVDSLERLARVAKIEAPADYRGRGVPRAAEDNTTDVFLNPPDPYAIALKAREQKVQ